MTANTTTSTHNMASSTLSSRLLTITHLEDLSGLSVYRHQLLPTPTHDILDTAATPQLVATTVKHLKIVSARGYFKPDNIGNPITSPLSTLSFYCFMAFMAFLTKTVTLGTAYVLGLAISLVTIFGTYNTILAMIIGTYLPYTSGPSILLISSFDMCPDSDLDHEYSPEVDSSQKNNNATRKHQYRKDRSTSKTKERLYNDLSPEDHCTLKEDETAKRQQENTITYVLDAPQHKSSRPQPTTYETLTPDLNTGQEPHVKKVEVYPPPQLPAIQPSESTFQMSLRNSMHRSKRPRRTRSGLSTSVQEYSSEDPYFKEEFQMTVCSDAESSIQYSGTSTPDSECSTSTTESDFQAGLRMMLCSPSPIRRRNRKGRRCGPSIVPFCESSTQESEFQTQFREAVWPAGSSTRRRRSGTPGRETGSESEE